MGRILGVFGTHDEGTFAQLADVASRAEFAALMADGHKGYVMPIGGVAAYDNKVSVVGVGFDIACGNAAIRTDLSLSSLGSDQPAINKRLAEIADQIAATISFGVGRANNAGDAPVDHPLFESDAWSLVGDRSQRDSLKDRARNQLGTVGSGNHYVDVLADENGVLWVGVHFGSRGFGHGVATGFLNLSQNKPWEARGAQEVEILLSLSDPLGHDYWHLMQLAGEYAYTGREWVARKVVSILGAKEVELVHNHHNFAWEEAHGGRDLIVVRKGATPAYPGQKGFIGGSMGDDAVIVQGTVSTEPEVLFDQEQALFSTVHGAGRVMSRTEAAGKRKFRSGEIIKPGKVSPEMMQAWLAEKGVILRGGGLDESPHAYRRLPDVLKAQGDTIEILHTLRPLIVAMAGENEFDPYKD